MGVPPDPGQCLPIPPSERYFHAMDAMILAAGLGTRLRPLTNDIPKALVEVGGVPMLEHVARRLIDAGADRLIINTHPHPDRIRAFVRERESFGVEVLFSHEPDAPLDTAGGLRHARALFRRDRPFFLHNCDVFTDIDLHALYAAHTAARDTPVATLAVRAPSEERYLVFDAEGMCGFSPRGGGAARHVREPVPPVERRDFTGIHVCEPDLLATLEGPDVESSIIMHYLHLTKAGRRVARFDQLDAAWIDIGTHEKLEVARQLHAGTRHA